MPIILRLLLAALACICLLGARTFTHQYNSQLINKQEILENSLPDASAGGSAAPADLAGSQVGALSPPWLPASGPVATSSGAATF